MYQSLQIFRTAAGLAAHAGARQGLAAQDVANADTPGYRARTLPAFTGEAVALGLRATRPGHLGGGDAAAARAVLAGGEASPNGNDVSLEAEMVASATAAREHGQALAVWRHAVGVLRTAIGR